MSAPQWRNLKITVGLLILLYLFPYTASKNDKDKCPGCHNGGVCYTNLRNTAPLVDEKCNEGWFAFASPKICYKMFWNELTNTDTARYFCNTTNRGSNLAKLDSDLCPRLTEIMKSVYLPDDKWPVVALDDGKDIKFVNVSKNCKVLQSEKEGIPLCFKKFGKSTNIISEKQCRCANVTGQGQHCIVSNAQNGSRHEEKGEFKPGCPKSFQLQIHFAAFGIDADRSKKMDCYLPNSLSLLQLWCQGRQSCDIKSRINKSPELFVSEKCKGQESFIIRRSCKAESNYTCPSGTYTIKAQSTDGINHITCLEFVGDKTWAQALETCRNKGGGLPMLGTDLNYTVLQGLIANTSELRVMKLKMWVGGNISSSSSTSAEIIPNTFLSIDIENKTIAVLEQPNTVGEKLPFVCNFDKKNDTCQKDTFDLSSVRTGMGTNTSKPCYKYESSKLPWRKANETCIKQKGTLAFYPHTTFPSNQIFNLLDPFLQSLRADQIEVWIGGQANDSRDYSTDITPCSSITIDNENQRVKINEENKMECLEKRIEKKVFCVLPPTVSEVETSKLSLSDVLLGDSPAETVTTARPIPKTPKRKNSFGVSYADSEPKATAPPEIPTPDPKQVADPDDSTSSTTATPVISLNPRGTKKNPVLSPTTAAPTAAFTVPSIVSEPPEIPPSSFQNPLTNPTPINKSSNIAETDTEEPTTATSEETASPISEESSVTESIDSQQTVVSTTDNEDTDESTVFSTSTDPKYTDVTDDSATQEKSTLQSTITTSPLIKHTLQPIKNCSKTVSQRGKLIWNETLPGVTQEQPCPGKAKGFVRWTCGWNGEFQGKPNFKDCSSLNSTEMWIIKLTKNGSSSEVVKNFSEEISTKTLYKADLVAVMNFSEIAVEEEEAYINSLSDSEQKLTVSLNFTEAIAAVIQKTLETDSDTTHAWHDLSEKQRAITGSKLLNTQERSGFILARSITNGSRSVIKDNFEITVTSYNDSFYESNDWKYPELSQKKNVSVEFPKGFAKTISENGVVRSVFIAYNNLTAVLPATSNSIKNESSRNDTDLQLITGVLGITLNNSTTNVQITNGKVKMEFIHLDETIEGTTYCVFWNMKDMTNPKWDPSGCIVEENSTYHTICLCDHLTNFAVLMDVHNTLKDSENDVKALENITIVGCTISIICLLMTFVIFTIFRSLWNLRTTIHRNLSLTLFIVQIVLLIGLDKTSNKIGCGIVAGTLHYFLLSAFFWMALEGVHIYVLLIKVFETGEPKSWRYYVAGYGLPAIIVAISASIRPNSYGTSRYCWLSNEHGFIFAFAGPMAIILTFNIVILILALRAAASVKAPRQQSKVESARLWIKRSASLLPLLGVTWVFGFLFVNKTLVVFAYFFAIFNSLQGLFIFIFHCVRNEKVQQVLSRYIAKKREKFESSTSGKQSRTNSCTVTSSLRVNNSEFTSGSRKSSKSSRNGSISPLKIGLTKKWKFKMDVSSSGERKNSYEMFDELGNTSDSEDSARPTLYRLQMQSSNELPPVNVT